MLRWLICIVLGCVPGLLVVALGYVRPGMAVVGLGAAIGMLYSAGGVHPFRTIKLLSATIVAKNVPVLGDDSYEWVDRGFEDAPKEDWLEAWLNPSHLASGKRWKVILGMGLGMLTGVGIAWHDLLQSPPGHGWMLPMTGAKDPIVMQAFLLTLATAIWGATAGGLLTSTVYRRVLGTAGLTAGLFGGCVGYASSLHSRTTVGSCCVFMITAGLVVGVMLAWDLDAKDDHTEARSENE